MGGLVSACKNERSRGSYDAHGGCIMADVNTRVQALLDRLVKRDVERGLQVAANLDGALVVDAWAGIADPSTRRPVNGRSVVRSRGRRAQACRRWPCSVR